jgi:tetratricopeptide (TPR) repeat protein
MSSIIEGYSYDIFISYRQKDNKYDGWVTEFVGNLKKELEATFKEEISVYFDINPHDGLLETHDVDASLKNKLKCLVFIPIISRTYCDPKSFAWEHEFKAFVEQASQDQFGLKVKLPTGNVANRVLPVRIHDLDDEDIKLCELVTGGFLRGIEFIYKEPGVNRSLLPKDHEEKNLNNTNYRNQINKVALAIKEVISGLKTEPAEPGTEKTRLKEAPGDVKKVERFVDRKLPVKQTQKKLLSGVLITVILVIAAIFVYSKIFKHDKLENLKSPDERISIAVMPFQNMTNDTIWNIWQNGIQDILITSLSNSEELKVRQAESINHLVENQGIVNYASITPSVASTISQKLDASVLIFGNIKQAGNIIRLYTQLIDSKTEEVFKSFKIEGENKEENIFHMIDSLSVIVKNFLIISELGKGIPAIYNITASTNSPEAYRYFIQGRNEFMKLDNFSAINWFSKAIAIDSNFIEAITMTAMAYGNQYVIETAYSSAYINPDLYKQAKKWCLKAYEKMDQLPMQEEISTKWLYSMYFETPYEGIKYLIQLLKIDDQRVTTHHNLGNCYFDLGQYNMAISEYEKVLEIYKKWGVKPYWILDYIDLGEAYYKVGKYKDEEKLYKKAERDFPDVPVISFYQAILSLTVGDTVKANRYIEKGISYLKSISMSEASIASILASGYATAGSMDKAEKYYRQALTLEPESSVRLNDLAYFLINNDRDIIQGIDLVEGALKLSPDHYIYLHTKGWGLYKQGKYQEALEMLQNSWDLRRQNAVYDHEAFLHLEAAKEAVAKHKNN